MARQKKKRDKKMSHKSLKTCVDVSKQIMVQSYLTHLASSMNLTEEISQGTVVGVILDKFIFKTFDKLYTDNKVKDEDFAGSMLCKLAQDILNLPHRKNKQPVIEDMYDLDDCVSDESSMDIEYDDDTRDLIASMLAEGVKARNDIYLNPEKSPVLDKTTKNKYLKLYLADTIRVITLGYNYRDFLIKVSYVLKHGLSKEDIDDLLDNHWNNKFDGVYFKDVAGRTLHLDCDNVFNVTVERGKNLTVKQGSVIKNTPKHNRIFITSFRDI